MKVFNGMGNCGRNKWSNAQWKHSRSFKLLFFWPAFGLLFLMVERGNITTHYHLVHCALDDVISFCEYFLIPNMFWFVFVGGMVLFTFFFDSETFEKLMKYIIITYSILIIIYLLFPTMQTLPPATFERDNLFTRFLTDFYAFDTNTNVCPSIHVIGALAVLFASWNSRHFHTTRWRDVFTTATILICISTVFLKQHSVLDILAALPICLAAYPIVYGTKPMQSRRNSGTKAKLSHANKGVREH